MSLYDAASTAGADGHKCPSVGDEGTIADVEIRKFDGRHWERSHAATGIAACSKVAT